jgi:hypothetical protein
MTQYFIFPIFILLMQSITVTTVMAGEVFRWVNEDGQVQYSYTRPAANYTALDHSGLKINEHQETDTPPENSSPPSPDPENNALENAEATTEADAKKRDEILLSSYLTVEELTVAYQKKQQAISEQIEHYEASLEMLLTRLMETREKLGIANDPSIKRKLQDHIKNSEEIQTAYEENILKQKNRLAEMDVQFLADKKRLEELLAQKAMKTPD